MLLRVKKTLREAKIVSSWKSNMMFMLQKLMKTFVYVFVFNCAFHHINGVETLHAKKLASQEFSKHKATH